MDENGGYSDYNNTHRAFLQSLLSQQTTTFTTAKPLLAAIQTAHDPTRPTLPEDVSREDFDNYIHTLNASISAFDLEIRSTTHQTSKERIYALVNVTSDALTQMATVHSADEIAFVKRVLDGMFETYNTPRAEVMAITSFQALKLAKPASETGRRESGVQNTQAANAGLTMSQAEKMLESMVAEGWFELSGRGYYSLSPRALMELRSWLIDTYNNQEEQESDEEEEEPHEKIKLCQACREIVTVGQRCPNMQCSARVHGHCVRNLFRAQGGREECPLCKTAWQDPMPVGEAAARNSGNSGTDGRRRTNGVSSLGGRRNQSRVAGAEDDSAESGAEED